MIVESKTFRIWLMSENDPSAINHVEKPRGWTLISAWIAMVAIGLSSFAIIFLVPKFVAVFEEMAAGTALPTMTVFVTSLSSFVSKWFLLLLLPIIGFVVYLLVGRPVSVIRILSVLVIVSAVVFFLVLTVSLLLPMQQLIQAMQV